MNKREKAIRLFLYGTQDVNAQVRAVHKSWYGRMRKDLKTMQTRSIMLHVRSRMDKWSVWYGHTR